jgi:hypothetical protein
MNYIDSDEQHPLIFLWISLHVTALILACLKMIGALEFISWFIIGIPLILDLGIICLIVIIILTLRLLSNRFNRNC